MLKGVLRKLFVLSAIYDGSGWRFTFIELIRIKKRVRFRGRSCMTDLEPLKKYRKEPFVLIIGGVGVISKIFDIDDASAGRISDNTGQFISCREPAGTDSVKLTFMRRELFDSLMQQLSIYKLPIISTRIDPDNNILKESTEAGNDFFGTGFSVSRLIRPTAETSILASLYTNKLMLPVLSGLMLILVLNFFIGRNLQQEFQQQQLLLNRLTKENSFVTDQKKQQAKLLSMLLPEFKYRYSLLADQIASVVPADVTLVELTINPLSKKIQVNKPLSTEINKIRIIGSCSLLTQTARFTTSLKNFGFVKDIKILSLDKDRTGNYIFEIELYL